VRGGGEICRQHPIRCLGVAL